MPVSHVPRQQGVGGVCVRHWLHDYLLRTEFEKRLLFVSDVRMTSLN